MKNESALVIFAKSPNKSPVKTRLSRHLSDARRLALYIHLLETTISKLRDVQGVDTFISYAPRDDEAYFARFGLRMFPQSRGDLGLRMHSALAEVLGRGYKKAVLVGVDIPELSRAQVLGAVDALSRGDVVFGPARDGGYYLVGVRMPVRELFEGIEWSAETTLRQSLERASALGLRCLEIEALDDIDTVEDLEKTGFPLWRL